MSESISEANADEARDYASEMQDRDRRQFILETVHRLRCLGVPEHAITPILDDLLSKTRP